MAGGGWWGWISDKLQAAQGRAEASFALFAHTLDPEWIDRALRATGKASVRRRKLPAEYVVWLVIGMGLLRDRSIQEVVRHLALVLPDADRGGQTVSGGAVVQARNRLGPQPLAWLFEQTAAMWATASAEEHRWRGLAVFGVGWHDGCACPTAPRTTPPLVAKQQAPSALGVREARLNLSELLAEVRKGREIVITDRGRPVARLVPTARTQGKPFASRRRFWASVRLKGGPLSNTVASARADRL